MSALTTPASADIIKEARKGIEALLKELEPQHEVQKHLLGLLHKQLIVTYGDVLQAVYDVDAKVPVEAADIVKSLRTLETTVATAWRKESAASLAAGVPASSLPGFDHVVHAALADGDDDAESWGGVSSIVDDDDDDDLRGVSPTESLKDFIQKIEGAFEPAEASAPAAFDDSDSDIESVFDSGAPSMQSHLDFLTAKALLGDSMTEAEVRTAHEIVKEMHKDTAKSTNNLLGLHKITMEKPQLQALETLHNALQAAKSKDWEQVKAAVSRALSIVTTGAQ